MDYTFLHRPKPKKFEYRPRFYDAEKEKQSGHHYEVDETERFARKLHSSWDRKRSRKQSRGLSPRVVILMVVVSCLLLYYIFA